MTCNLLLFQDLGGEEGGEERKSGGRLEWNELIDLISSSPLLSSRQDKTLKQDEEEKTYIEYGNVTKI